MNDLLLGLGLGMALHSMLELYVLPPLARWLVVHGWK